MTKTNNSKLKVFLCHASEDKLAVRELYQRLKSEGWIDPWLDEEKLLPGQDWDLEIKKAVEETDVVLVAISNNSVSKSGYVQKEIKKVLDVSDEKPEGKIFLIPLRLENIEPPRRLARWQYTDYFPAINKKQSYDRLMMSLRLLEKEIESPDSQAKLFNLALDYVHKMIEQKIALWEMGNLTRMIDRFVLIAGGMPADRSEILLSYYHHYNKNGIYFDLSLRKDFISGAKYRAYLKDSIDSKQKEFGVDNFLILVDNVPFHAKDEFIKSFEDEVLRTQRQHRNDLIIFSKENKDFWCWSGAIPHLPSLRLDAIFLSNN